MLDFLTVSDLRRASRAVLFFSVICLALQNSVIVSEVMVIASIQIEVSRDGLLRSFSYGLAYFLAVLAFRALQEVFTNAHTALMENRDLADKYIEQSKLSASFRISLDEGHNQKVEEMVRNTFLPPFRREIIGAMMDNQRRVFRTSVGPDILMPVCVGMFTLYSSLTQ